MTKQPHNTAVLLGSASFVFLNFGLPVRADELGMDALAIGGTYTVFTATLLLLRPLVGICLDRFGRRWFFSGAFVFYALAMTVFSGLEGVGGFYLGRFLQGIGAALMWVTARTIVADTNPSSQYAEAMGALTVSSVRGSMFGAFFGFTLLGFLPMATAWQWAFAGYALAALGALLWSLRSVPESRPLTHAGQTDDNPLPRTRAFWQVLLIVFLTSFATTLVEPIYLLMLRHKFEVGAQLLAAVFLPAGLVYAVLPRYAGRWADRYSRPWLVVIGVTAAALVMASMPMLPALSLVAASYIFFACGWAVASPALEGMTASFANTHNRGRVMGAKEAASGVGAAVGPLLGGALYEYVSVVSAFWLNGLVLILAAAMTLYFFLGSARQDDAAA
ncbi:MAG: MFS transporter [Pseudomonadota bacterium]